MSLYRTYCLMCGGWSVRNRCSAPPSEPTNILKITIWVWHTAYDSQLLRFRNYMSSIKLPSDKLIKTDSNLEGCFLFCCFSKRRERSCNVPFPSFFFFIIKGVSSRNFIIMKLLKLVVPHINSNLNLTNIFQLKCSYTRVVHINSVFLNCSFKPGNPLIFYVYLNRRPTDAQRLAVACVAI